MKKILALAVIAMFAVSASAQRGKVASKGALDNVEFYGHAGLTFASLAGDDADDWKSNTGWNLGAEFRKPLKGAWYWGAGIGLQTKGAKMKGSTSDDKVTLNITTFEVPVNFGYMINLAQGVDLDLHAGAFVDVDMFGKFKVKSGGMSDSSSMGDWDDFSRLNLGVQAGLGLWFNQIGVNLGYSYGFMQQWEDVEWYPSDFTVSLLYKF